jgi:cobalamin biosynthesis protein CobD/CbiB
MATTLLSRLWCLPLTAVGYGLRLFTPRCEVLQRQGVTLIYGASTARLLDVAGYAAMAVGEVVFARNRPDVRAHLAHELRHVRQARKWGLLFPLLYLASSLGCVLTGRNAYRDNAFERAARRAESRAESRAEKR